MQEAVSQRILRRVSTRDHAAVLDPLCEGNGIEKSSVSRHWKAASAGQLRQMLERCLVLVAFVPQADSLAQFTLIRLQSGHQRHNRQPRAMLVFSR